MSKNYFFLMLCFVLVFSSCKKTDTNSTTDPPLSNPANTITASISGRVTDIKNAPVSNASVSAGSSVTVTDLNGQYSITNAQLEKDAGFVKVTKAGYFQGSRTFLVKPNSNNNIKIQLIPKALSGNFAVSTGGTISVEGGGSVVFGAGNMVNPATGAAYSGDAFVSTFDLDPTNADFATWVPGDLQGLDAANQQRILKPFAMILVEMNNTAGDKLQLAAGKTATIALPIPADLQAIAPGTLPLWYFDDTKGQWKEEGTATRQGNNYVGKVAHFTFWTVGQLLGQSIKLDANFKDKNGLALINKLVTITSAVYGTTKSYTDSSGSVSGLVPATESLVMQALDQCGEVMYTKNIGPFSADVNLGNITVTNTSSGTSITLSGTVLNCSNQPVTNGYVQANTGNDHFKSPIVNGSFKITFDRCPNSLTADTIFAFDASNNQQSSGQTIYVDSLGNLGISQLIACGSSPANTIKLEGTFKDQNGKPFIGNYVKFTSPNFVGTTSITDSNGTFRVQIPSAETLTMQAFSNICNDILYTQQVGPFTNDTNLGDIAVNYTAPFNLTLTGTVVNCNNTAVTHGYVQVMFGNSLFNSPITNGSFSVSLGRCDNTTTQASIIAYDSDTNESSQSLTENVGTGSQDFGQLIACPPPPSTEEYIYLNLKGIDYAWTPVMGLTSERVDSGGYYNTSIHAGDPSATGNNNYVLLGILRDNASPGNYDFHLYCFLNNSTYNSSSPGNSLTTTVTEYGLPGGYITGTASGQVLELSTGNLLPFSCRYRVKRNQ